MKNKFLLVIVSLVSVFTGLIFLINHYAVIQPDEHALHLLEESAEHEHSEVTANTPITDTSTRDSSVFTTDVTGLPEAGPTDTVELQHGDTYEITAAYVKKQVGNNLLRMLAYNGSVPGPFIRAPQDAEITINFTNNTDIEQTIHSHGIRVNNLADGVPGITQDSVKPGQAYTYKIKFSDAGVYWYHPHTREDYGQELGLYGNYLVTPSRPDYWNTVNREVPLVIDDILIEDDRIADFYTEYTNYALLGRFGNEYLVNGEHNYSLQVTQGEVIRFFVTNVSNARTYQLSLPGVQMKIVGADIGKYEREIFSDSIILSPGERTVVEAYFATTGNYTLLHTMPDRTINLANIIVTEETNVDTTYATRFKTLRENADVIAEFSGFSNYLQTEPDKKLLLTITLEGQQIDHSEHAHLEMAVDHDQPTLTEHAAHAHPEEVVTDPLAGMQWDDTEQGDRFSRTPAVVWKVTDEQTGKTSMQIDDWVFKTGELVKVRLTNDNNADHVMQHPIHFHGQRFVVLSVDGRVNENLAWKDTAMIMPGQSAELLISMDNSGVWMAHCHISEHLHAGMMFTFRVEDNDGYATGDEYRAGLLSEHQH